MPAKITPWGELAGLPHHLVDLGDMLLLGPCSPAMAQDHQRV